MCWRCENGDLSLRAVGEMWAISKISRWWHSQSRKESILNCLLIANRAFIYKMISRKLSDLVEEGKQETNCGNENINGSLFGMTYITGRKDKLTANKRPTSLWPGYFLTWREKSWKFGIFRGNFQTQTKDSWPDLTRVKIFWPRLITSLCLVTIWIIFLHQSTSKPDRLKADNFGKLILHLSFYLPANIDFFIDKFIRDKELLQSNRFQSIR